MSLRRTKPSASNTVSSARWTTASLAALSIGGLLVMSTAANRSDARRRAVSPALAQSVKDATNSILETLRKTNAQTQQLSIVERTLMLQDAHSRCTLLLALWSEEELAQLTSYKIKQIQEQVQTRLKASRDALELLTSAPAPARAPVSVPPAADSASA